jgi:hypothetical protein
LLTHFGFRRAIKARIHGLPARGGKKPLITGNAPSKIHPVDHSVPVQIFEDIIKKHFPRIQLGKLRIVTDNIIGEFAPANRS